MKPKTVISLLAVVLILAATSYFLLNKESSEKNKNSMGIEFMQTLPVNEIAAITIQQPDSLVELERGPNVWQVKSRYGYPADFAQISDFVKQLKQLKSGRAFDAGKDVLARQSLYDPTDNSAEKDQKGTRITLSDKTGKKLADLILGKPRQADAGGSGHYMRFADENTVHLVNATFSVTDPNQWLEKEIINIVGEAIQMVVCYARDSNKVLYRLERKERDQAPELLSAPQKAAADANKIDQVFEALSPLTIDDISGPPRQSKDPIPSTNVRLEYHLYDGRVITVYPNKMPGDDPQNAQYLVSLTVDYLPPQSQDSDEAEKPSKEPADKKDQAGQDETPNEKAEKSAKEIKADALAQNEKLKKWDFKIAKWQYDSFINTKEGLLEEKAEKTTTSQ